MWSPTPSSPPVASSARSNTRSSAALFATPVRSGVPARPTGRCAAPRWPASTPTRCSWASSGSRAGALVRRLAGVCDLVIENFSPKVKRGLGIDYPELCRERPDLILVSLSSLGQDGPQADRPGLGFHLQALAGFNHVTGWADREPFGSLPYTDYIVAPLGALAAIAALEYRRRTGRGQFIDLSQVEAALLFLAPALLDYTANGRDFERRGNFSAEMAPHGIYRTADPDGWIAIAAPDDRAWS